jgi:acyl-CoA synthetase (AMP-forming)/AMP-acid ligase II
VKILGNIHDLNDDKVWNSDDIHQRSIDTASKTGVGNHIIAHGNSGAFFADLFGVWESGGCAIVVNPGLTSNELNNIIEFTDARTVVYEDRVDKLYSTPIRWHLTLDDDALVLFTSGTTGDPKGVIHTHRSLIARVSLNQSYIPETYKTLCVLPTHFGHGLIGNCLTPLFAGHDLFLSRGNTHTAAMLDRIIDRNGITFMSSVPSFWRMVLRLSNNPDCSTLRRVNIGSAPLSESLWEDVITWSGCNVANMYGITETANWIGGAESDIFNPENGLVGRVWGGQAAVFRDGEMFSEGDGEILVKTPSLMRKYFKRDDLTSDAIKGGWYFTGDIGNISDGIIFLTGRSKYVINKGGMKIYPEEIDLLLESHYLVEEACTFGVGENIVAAVKIQHGKDITGQDILKWISERIHKEAVPNKIIILDDIPKTDRGKLNREQVKEHCFGDRD